MAASTQAVLAGCLVFWLSGPVVRAASANEMAGRSAAPQPAGRADLVVSLSLVTDRYVDSNAGGIICYSVTPQFTVTNRGQATAQGFRVRLEWKPAPGQGWQVQAYSPNHTLSPGQSFSEGPNPNSRTKWCEGDGLNSVGFRVTADDENAVVESNERNNTAAKLFPSALPYKKPHIPGS